jgi:hypothetical protein
MTDKKCKLLNHKGFVQNYCVAPDCKADTRFACPNCFIEELHKEHLKSCVLI